MLFSLYLYRSRILYLRVHSCLWGISNPLSNKYLIFLWEEIRALPFPHIIHPMTFKMIPTSFCQYTIPTSLVLEPHAFINVPILINHSTFTMWLVVHPHTIIPVSRLVEHGTTALFLVRLPVPRVLSTELVLSICNPEGALSVAFICLPASFVFIGICIVLNTKAVFLIIKPVPYIFVWTYPFIGLLRTIFIQRLFLHVNVINVP